MIKQNEPFIHRIYMSLLCWLNRKSTDNADKVVHISKYARDEYYQQRGYINFL